MTRDFIGLGHVPSQSTDFKQMHNLILPVAIRGNKFEYANVNRSYFYYSIEFDGFRPWTKFYPNHIN